MRVVLVRPLSRCPTYDPEVQEPLGIEALAAVLRAAGHDVLLQDAMLSPSPESVLAGRIAGYRPRVVGLSLMSDADLESSLVLLQQVRELLGSGVIFVAGGSFISTEPERAALSLPERTLMVRYEGERPLLRLLQAIENAEPLEAVPSLLWRQGGRLLASCAPMEWVDELDSLPWPARDDLPAVISRCRAVNL